MSPRAFSFNSPHGGCPTARASARSGISIPTASCPTRRCRCRKAPIAPWAAGDERLVAGGRHGAGPHTSASTSRCRSASCRSARTTCCSVTAPRGAGRRPTRVARPRARRTRTARASRASSRTCAGATNRPTWVDQADIERYRSLRPCEGCHGERLRPESRAVQVKGRTITQLVGLPVSDALRRLRVDSRSRSARKLIAGRIRREIVERLRFLVDVGRRLSDAGPQRGHAVGRRGPAHPAGDADRREPARRALRARRTVASACTSATTGGCSTTLRRLRDLGNTVIVVEHDEETIRAADYVVDLGPGAGEHGGRVIFQGTPDNLLRHGRESLTGQYLRGERMIDVPPSPAHAAAGRTGGPRRAGEQPQEPRRAHPARPADRRHRRERVGQVHARQRHPVPRAGAHALPGQRRARPPTTASRASSSSTR